ncbi:MAG: hypothetical protein KC418_05055 [Anaerolineales bacterium]|nr:hypothetical protein [Anaerolineales bacterium]MCB8950507.1 hypothetical protein [Ardenticatenales bacterium]
MSIAVLVHIVNEEPIAADLEEMPDVRAQYIALRNPRRRDGKDLHYLEEEVATMLIPWHRINFVQVMPAAGAEEIIGFVRE